VCLVRSCTPSSVPVQAGILKRALGTPANRFFAARSCLFDDELKRQHLFFVYTYTHLLKVQGKTLLDLLSVKLYDVLHLHSEHPSDVPGKLSHIASIRLQYASDHNTRYPSSSVRASAVFDLSKLHLASVFLVLVVTV